MMLKRKSSKSQSSPWKLLRAGLAGLGAIVGAAALTGGCLDRPVAPAVPRTNNVYVDEIRQTAVDKIDLLFMIDNSISMADKQAILASAVPLLVQRLITPICVDGNGTALTGNVNVGPDGKCAQGSPEFSPINDIHVGVITSSLGSHGAVGTNDVCVQLEDNDRAHLLGEIRGLAGTWNNQGFLKWDPKMKYTPPGDTAGMAFSTKFTEMVQSSKENGCGYEASLEAWYRFLIDPEPAASVTVNPEGRAQESVESDLVVLAQRAAFLRPDSLVAIVMLSDENDCSIVDQGYGWLISRAPNKNTSAMFRSTSQCLTDPNSECCQSCGETTARPGCPAIASDAECQKGKTLSEPGEDDLNLRCWEQKRRFGFDLLYPTTRYSDALRSPVVTARSTGKPVANPLFTPTAEKPARDKGLVFLAGIIGVPWQDIADDASLPMGAGLRYQTAEQLAAGKVWDVILGDPSASPPVLPKDPFMVETPVDRTTIMGLPRANPRTGEMLAAGNSTNPQANVINGHEQTNVGNRDLQYACTFELEEAVTCDDPAFMAGAGCDCFVQDAPYNRPLCQPPGGGAAGIKQYYAKAYPGLRHLQVLKEFGDNSIVASICPKVLDKTASDFGYNPAVKAIIDRLTDALKGKCLPRPLVPNSKDKTEDGLEPGQVPCAVVEAVLPQNGAACACDPSQNRISLEAGPDNKPPARPELRKAVLAKLKEGGSCGVADGTPCADFCTCELKQLSGGELQSCQNDATEPSVPGYCYVNAAPNEPPVGNPELVKACAADSRRLLRFVGGTPAPGAIALVACLGDSLGSTE